MKSTFRFHIFPAIMAAGLLLAGCGKPSGTVTYSVSWEDCLNQLVNFDQLASLDPVNLKTLTSYDRTGGNNDFNNFAGKSRNAGWVVLADEKGPGCIRRFWMTGTDPGHPIRIYIDGESTPRIDSTLDDLFGQTEPWTPPLSHYVNMCFYSYIPITFNKSIRIEVKEPNVHPMWGPRRIFFQIAVESFSSGTSVESYPTAFTANQLQAARTINDRWQSLIESRTIPDLENQTSTTIPPQAAGTMVELPGPLMINHWTLHVQPADPQSWSALDKARLIDDAVLRVYYDGQASPGIDVPLGDFFGNAWNKRSFSSVWMTSAEDGFECRLPLPFKQGIKVELLNGSDHSVSVAFHYSTRPYPTNLTGYLHAEYRKSGPGGGRNHAVTKINGRGKYLGCFLGVTGLDASWWILEGDERMWVDGQSNPVWLGTGLEDYFNGGWYYRGVAFGGLNGNLDRAPFRSAQYRHQHADPVTFNQYFFMEFERMNDEQSGRPVNGYFESTAYLYMEKPTPVAACPVDRNDRRAVENPNDQKTFMLQLVELERSNDFEAAIRAIQEYIEKYPGSDELGVYRLRMLEYRRLLGEAVTSADYEAFRLGNEGPAAQEQVKLLDWFYESENRAIVGLSVNGKGKLFLDGRMVLNGDHPFYLFTAGIELTPGPHQIAAQVDYQRDSPWLQAGIRTHQGVAGTGPGTSASLAESGNWKTDPVSSLNWHRIGIRDIPRGVPDAPFIGGIANAFILVQSKSYPVSAPDWIYYRKTALFREDFTIPLSGWPEFSVPMTGLRK